MLTCDVYYMTGTNFVVVDIVGLIPFNIALSVPDPQIYKYLLLNKKYDEQSEQYSIGCCIQMGRSNKIY